MDSRERLKKLFTDGFRALDLARPLPSFDHVREAGEIRGILEATQAAVAGVRTAGLVNGYVLAEELTDGTLGSHLRPFARGQALGEDAGIQSAISVLGRHDHCFVATLGTVDAVIGRSDVDRPAARMWLFGVITMIEMNMVETIEQRFRDESWRERLPPGRLRMAEDLLTERKRRGQNVTLLDCLQLGDKAQILVQERDVMAEAGFASVRAAKRALKDLGSLRNSLAHAQDITTYDWAAVVLVAERLDVVLSRSRDAEEEAGRALVERARRFAVAAHEQVGHRRKYTNEPYSVHLEAVAAMVAGASDDPHVIAAAWLHDTVEDTPTTIDSIESRFGSRVAQLVDELTDVSRPIHGNRESRKAVDHEHSGRASSEAKTVKLADVIDNVKSIVELAPRFGRVYIEENERLLPLLVEGDPELFCRAERTLADGRQRLEQGETG